jgi:hypothetical protein
MIIDVYQNYIEKYPNNGTNVSIILIAAAHFCWKGEICPGVFPPKVIGNVVS